VGKNHYNYYDHQQSLLPFSCEGRNKCDIAYYCAVGGSFCAKLADHHVLSWWRQINLCCWLRRIILCCWRINFCCWRISGSFCAVGGSTCAVGRGGSTCAVGRGGSSCPVGRSFYTWMRIITITITLNKWWEYIYSCCIILYKHGAHGGIIIITCHHHQQWRYSEYIWYMRQESLIQGHIYFAVSVCLFICLAKKAFANIFICSGWAFVITWMSVFRRPPCVNNFNNLLLWNHWLDLIDIWQI